MKPHSPSDHAPRKIRADPATQDNPALQRIRFVLESTSHPGNIGATARALKTMGLAHLSLVTPRYADAIHHADALALATGADDVLSAAEVHPTLTSALQDCVWTVALTARNRFYSPSMMSPREAAQRAFEVASQGGKVAFVFGSERYGLDNDDVMTCQAVCAIPTSASYSSLNLAQAVQIVAYECQLASLATATVTHADPATLATIEEREQLYTHLQEALIAIEFLDRDTPTKLMHRIRRIFARNELEHEEVSILRGICSNILAPRRTPKE